MCVCVCVRFPYIIAVLSTTNRDISCHYNGDDHDNYDDDKDDHGVHRYMLPTSSDNPNLWPFDG